MNLIAGARLKGARLWMISVLLLSLPSVIFVVLHALYAPDTLPEFPDFVVVWTITLTGMFGALLTVAACVLSVAAILQKNVPRAAKLTMLAFVSFSLLACLYMSRVSP